MSKGRRMPRGVLGPAAVVAVVLASTFFAVPPLWDAATHAPVPFASLDLPWAYLAGAPLFGLWDSLTNLTWSHKGRVLPQLVESQHSAVLLWLIALYMLRRVLAPPGKGSPLLRAVVEGGRGVLALAFLLAFYAAGVFLPRPMTGIALNGPSLVAVDFHSHTNHSHDGVKDFTASRNRAWHEAAGFGAAYVTDHYTWAGVDDALPDNPQRAGERTVLLSGAELRLRNRHTNVLGDRDRYVFALDSTWHHLDPDSLVAAQTQGALRPTMIYPLPAPLDAIVPWTPASPAGVVGVELNDGAPEGLGQVRAERSRILAMADLMDLAVVAGSNMHGWGRTAVAWSVMDIPGWRDMTPARLGEAIEATLHRDRRNAVVVVERRMPYHDGSRLLQAATLPWLLWEHFRMLAPAERVSWLAWALLAFAVGRVSPRRVRARPSLGSSS